MASFFSFIWERHGYGLEVAILPKSVTDKSSDNLFPVSATAHSFIPLSSSWESGEIWNIFNDSSVSSTHDSQLLTAEFAKVANSSSHCWHKPVLYLVDWRPASLPSRERGTATDFKLHFYQNLLPTKVQTIYFQCLQLHILSILHPCYGHYTTYS